MQNDATNSKPPINKAGSNKTSSNKASSWFRMVSLSFALAASLLLMVFPFLLRHVPEARLHSALPVLMFGIAGAFVYGIGYRPDHRAVRFLLGPICAWAMIAAGILWMAMP